MPHALALLVASATSVTAPVGCGGAFGHHGFAGTPAQGFGMVGWGGGSEIFTFAGRG